MINFVRMASQMPFIIMNFFCQLIQHTVYVIVFICNTGKIIQMLLMGVQNSGFYFIYFQHLFAEKHRIHLKFSSYRFL